MPKYGEALYWDKRYKLTEGKTFDWLEDYFSLEPILDKLIFKEDKILNLGCGNSILPEQMYDIGYKNIINIIADCIKVI